LPVLIARGINVRGVNASVHVVLVRHGRTAWNHERRVLGRTDLPLDEVGRQEAAAVAGALVGDLRALGLEPPRAIWSSPLARARETAEAIGRACDLAVAMAPGLIEMDQGDLEGMGAEELVERFGPLLGRWRSDPEHLRLPGGETMGETRDRVRAQLVELAVGGGTVVCVSHQLAMASVLADIAGAGLAAWRQWTHPNTGWAVLRVGGAIEIAHARGGSHLPR
jgi:broad specificity phosphatase PhoE